MYIQVQYGTVLYNSSITVYGVRGMILVKLFARRTRAIFIILLYRLPIILFLLSVILSLHSNGLIFPRLFGSCISMVTSAMNEKCLFTL